MAPDRKPNQADTEMRQHATRKHFIANKDLDISTVQGPEVKMHRVIRPNQARNHSVDSTFLPDSNKLLVSRCDTVEKMQDLLAGIEQLSLFDAVGAKHVL